MARKIIGTIMVVMVITAAVVYFGAWTREPVLKPVAAVVENITQRKVYPTVKSDTIMVRMYEYSCGDTELHYRGPVPGEMVGLDEKRLLMMFPRQEGWSLVYTPQEVVLTRKITGLCGVHQQYRHLGLHQGFLAIYQGPLGYDGVLLRLEKNIAVDLLPESVRKQLQQTASFNQLGPAEQIALKSTMEFMDELALNTALDNFDEYIDSPR